MASEPVVAAVNQVAGGRTSLLEQPSRSAFHPRELGTSTCSAQNRVNGHEGALPPLSQTPPESCRSRTVQQTVEPCAQKASFCVYV